MPIAPTKLSDILADLYPQKEDSLREFVYQVSKLMVQGIGKISDGDLKFGSTKYFEFDIDFNQSAEIRQNQLIEAIGSTREYLTDKASWVRVNTLGWTYNETTGILTVKIGIRTLLKKAYAG